MLSEHNNTIPQISIANNDDGASNTEKSDGNPILGVPPGAEKQGLTLMKGKRKEKSPD